jgi:hypothetical protein
MYPQLVAQDNQDAKVLSIIQVALMVKEKK